jgi:hypothetical protein
MFVTHEVDAATITVRLLLHLILKNNQISDYSSKIVRFSNGGGRADSVLSAAKVRVTVPNRQWITSPKSETITLSCFFVSFAVKMVAVAILSGNEKITDYFFLFTGWWLI